MDSDSTGSGKRTFIQSPLLLGPRLRHLDRLLSSTGETLEGSKFEDFGTGTGTEQMSTDEFGTPRWA